MACEGTEGGDEVKGWLIQFQLDGGYLMQGLCVSYTRDKKKARVFKTKPHIYADERLVEIERRKPAGKEK